MNIENFENFNLNNILLGIKPPDTVALNDRIQELQNKGLEIINLNVGDPDFDTPVQIVNAAYAALKNGYTHYASSRGLPQFRKAAADKILSSTGVELDPENEILAASGAVHAYFTGLSAILNPGDEVLIPVPTWMTHFNMVKYLGGTPIHVPAKIENNFFPSIEDFEKSITEKTIAVVINSPSNPTGAVAGIEYLQNLVSFAKKHKIYIISDEVYEKIIFDNIKYTSIYEIDGAKEITLLLNSFSKTYSMTGWRLGYLAAPANVINSAAKVSQYTLTNHQAFIQLAGIEALTNSNILNEIASMVQEYEKRRNIATSILRNSKAEIKFNIPAGAFYYFIGIHSTGLSSKECAEKILDEEKVAVVPGSVYGNNGEGFIRISLAASEDKIKNGFNRIVDWINRNSINI